jgi:hypothetical protein
VVQAALVSPPATVPVKSHPKGTATGNGGNSKTEGQGLAGESGSAWGSIAWGGLCVAISLGAWLVARRRQVLVRAGVYLAGAVVIVVPLFFFFQSVTPLLPASY